MMFFELNGDALDFDVVCGSLYCMPWMIVGHVNHQSQYKCRRLFLCSSCLIKSSNRPKLTPIREVWKYSDRVTEW